MEARDARLLPRLFAALDSNESDGEIVQLVRQVRRISGEQAFSGLYENVVLVHSDRAVALRLRSLGLAIARCTQAMDPATAAAVTRAASAMVSGGPVTGADLVLALSVLRDILQAEAEQMPPPGAMPPPSAVELRAAMDAVSDLIRRR